MKFDVDISTKNFPRCFTKSGTKNVCKWSFDFNNMVSTVPYSGNPTQKIGTIVPQVTFT